MKAINKSQIILLISIIGLTSCLTSNKMSSIELELLKPSILTNYAKIDTIAIFNRYQFQADTAKYVYFMQDEPKTDTTIHYKNLSNVYIKTLVNYLDSANYLSKVINLCDSANYSSIIKKHAKNKTYLCNTLGVDACIILKSFEIIDNQYIEKKNIISGIKEDFEEFENSTELARILINSSWIAYYKNDSLVYKFDLFNDSYYGNSVYPEFFGTKEKHKLLLENTMTYFGKMQSEKLAPKWETDSRNIYHSNNVKMLNAEKFCKEGKWLEAAEIYKRETMNPNRIIATKAKYNMALICEMEGKLDQANDWLLKSYAAYKLGKMDHKCNCMLYIDLIAKRKKELEKLDKQMGNSEMN